MKSIVLEKAVETLLSSSIDSLPVSMQEISGIIKDKGYRVISYKETDINMLKEMGIYEIVGTSKGFTVCSKKLKAVFLKNSLSAQEQFTVLVHELGHIVLGHFSRSGVLGYDDNAIINLSQEQEAEDFRRIFLAPVCILKKARIFTLNGIIHATSLNEVDASAIIEEMRNISNYTPNELRLQIQFKRYIQKHKKRVENPIFVIIVSILILTAVSLNKRQAGEYMLIATPTSMPTITATQSTMYTTTPSSVSPTNENDVVITRTGEKFHKSNCIYVESKDDTITITVEEALHQGLEPCEVCKPAENVDVKFKK